MYSRELVIIMLHQWQSLLGECEATHTRFIQAKEDERNPSMYLFISFSLFQWWQIYSATVPFPFIVSGFVSGEPPPPSVGERRNGVSTDGDEEGKENENRKYEGRL